MGAPALINRHSVALLNGARARGFDDATIARNVGVPLRPPASAYTPEDYARISRGVKLLTQDEFCGLTESRCRTGCFRMMTQLAVQSGTLGAALSRAFEFYSLVTDDIAYDLVESGASAAIRMRIARPELDPSHVLAELWFLMWNGFGGWMVGEEVPVETVELPHEPAGPLEEYAEALGAPVRFGRAEAVMTFDRNFLSRRIVRSPENLAAWYACTRIDLVNKPGIERSLRSLLKEKMRAHLHQHERFLTLDRLAHEFGLSPQTLRRRLDQQGTSYRAVKEEVRREAVMRWLAQPNIPIGEVSLRAGFAEPNGLFRAVKLWVGMSPAQYRDLKLRRDGALRWSESADAA